MLDGQYATTVLTADRVEETDGIFDYTRSERGFEEVMAYYHSDAVKRYLDELDYANFSDIRTDQIEIDAHSSEVTPPGIAFFDTDAMELHLSDGGSSGVDAAEDAMVIWHENFHGIVADVLPGFGYEEFAPDYYREASAFEEGAADYWAASRFAGTGARGHESEWDAYVGRWAGGMFNDGFPTTPPTPRFSSRVDESATYPENYEDNDGYEHENGLIWGSALWSIRQLTNFGRERTDRLLIHSLDFLAPESGRFREIAKAFLAANTALYAGADAAAIKTVLTNKGIYYELSDLVLTPSTVVGGGPVIGQVILTAKAPYGDAVVTLSETHSAASVPATVTVPEGETSATFSISTSAVGPSTPGNITATYDGIVIHENLDVTP